MLVLNFCTSLVLLCPRAAVYMVFLHVMNITCEDDIPADEIDTDCGLRVESVT